MEADQAWKDTNDVLLSHQLKYDAELTEFITEIERILQAKHMEIWDHVTCIAETVHPAPLLLQHDSNAAGILPRVLQPLDMGPHGGWGLSPEC